VPDDIERLAKKGTVVTSGEELKKETQSACIQTAKSGSLFVGSLFQIKVHFICVTSQTILILIKILEKKYINTHDTK
jgi:hypothetical protein